MSRLGMNPGRGKASAYRPARVTAAVLVYIPHFSGYFEGRFPVLIACLTSLVENTAVPLDLLVFDNGSCAEVQDYLGELQSRGAIQLLLRSARNLGKAGALRLIFGAAPGDVVAYCDDDFYYFPGWLEAQLEILDTFPNVGMVSGYTIPSLFAPERISAALEFGRSPGAGLKAGKFIPEEWNPRLGAQHGAQSEAGGRGGRGDRGVRHRVQGPVRLRSRQPRPVSGAQAGYPAVPAGGVEREAHGGDCWSWTKRSIGRAICV